MNPDAGVMIAPGQALPRVHMMICCPGGKVALGQLHWPGASLWSSDHYEIISISLVFTQIVTVNEF